jgi:predicted anti-sigma-YlaC factor YlaD
MDSCRDISALVSRAMDERLPPVARLRIRLHLLICGACRRFEAQVQLLRTAARQVASRALAPRPGDDTPQV